jgi:hypothetical protein
LGGNLAGIGPTPGVQFGPPPGTPPDAATDGGSFWDRGQQAGGGLFGNRAGQPGQQGPRYAWQNLPRLLGDQGRDFVNTGGGLVSELAPSAPEKSVATRTASGGGGTVFQGRVEVPFQDGQSAVGFAGGFASVNGVSAGLAPTVYGKRVLRATDDGVFGGGLGATLPADVGGASGSLFPWLFATRRVRGDVWSQGLVSLTVPFSRAADLAVNLDYGLLVPVGGAAAGADGLQVYFLPELHGSFALRGGSGVTIPNGAGTFNTRFPNGVEAGNAPRYGSGFVLNTTLGFGVRKGPFDLQVGFAVPLLDNRFYRYETIARVTYRY